MKILVTGATGFIGKKLVKKLLDQGHQIVVTSRNITRAQTILGEQVQVHFWAAPSASFPPHALQGVDAVINLMGESIAQRRWSDKQKLRLRESRIVSTKKLIDAVNGQGQKSVKVFLNASAIGFYALNQEQKLNEDSPVGDHFLASLCEDWEKQLQELNSSIRRLVVRVGVVLGQEGGALSKLLPLFKLGLGGKVSNGKQIMSWIHVDDLVQILIESLSNEQFLGVVNAVSPYPVSNQEFTKTLAKTLMRPALFPVPAAVVQLALGEMSSIVLDSQNIDCQSLKKWNFTFQYPKIDKALQQICGK